MRLKRWALVAAAVAVVAGAGLYGVVAPRNASADARTLFGVSIQPRDGETYDTAFANREAAYGTLGVVRVFFSGNPGSWTDTKLSAKRPMNVSFKALPDVVNSGSLDATYRAWFKAAPTDRAIWWTYFHEPEDDIANASFTAAAYRTAWQRIWRISRESGVAHDNVKAALVLMDYTVDATSKRNWRDYYPGDQFVDVISWDVYGFHEEDAATDNDESMAQHQQRRPSLAVTRAAGKAYAISELGYNTAGPRPAWLRDTARWAQSNGAMWVAYFDSTGTLGDHRLLDAASQAAWRDAVTGMLWAGAPTVTLSAGATTASSVRWVATVDPKGGTLYIGCASWIDGADGSFREDPAAARHVAATAGTVTCERTGLPPATEVTVRAKAYAADGTLQLRSNMLVIATTA